MIIEQTIKTTISNNGRYYRSLGYGDCKQGNVIFVKIDHLRPNSNKLVECLCDDCGIKFDRIYQILVLWSKDGIHRCYDCARVYVTELNKTNGTFDKISAANSNRLGESHPRWREDKPAYQAYTTKVRWLSEKTYNEYRYIINPNNYPRTLCGIDGGYQLDHITSVKEGFERQIPAEQLAELNNLQMLSWQDNLAKRHAA